MNTTHDKLAVITGASRGLGRALAVRLAQEGWRLLLTARGAEALDELAQRLGAVAVAGDVTDPAHRTRIAEAVSELGGLDLLVNNASHLGAAPLPRVAEYPLESLTTVLSTNVIAPVALIQALLPQLRTEGAIINISSDAAHGPYEGWSGYGASKAALDQVGNVLGTEEPAVRVWSVDPSEMRTGMLAAAVGDEEADQAPDPADLAVPAIARLLDERPASGRYLATELVETTGARS